MADGANGADRADEQERDGNEGTAGSPGCLGDPSGEGAIRRPLWGLVGGFAFLVLAQGYLLVDGDPLLRYVGLFALAGTIVVASGGIAYATEYRLHAKRRT